MLAEQINSARRKTKILYSALEKAKLEVQDSSFFEITAPTCQPITSAKASSFLKPFSTLKGHFDKVNDICWSDDCKYLVSLSQDGFILVWDPVSSYKKYAIPLQNQYALTCGISSNNKYVASAGLDSTCTIYQLHSDSSAYIKCILGGHTAYILDCLFQNQSEIITALGDLSCALWDYDRGVRIREFFSHNGDVLCLSSNEKFNTNCFASGSSDGTIKIWDSRQLREVQTFFVSDTDVNCIKFFPGGNAVVSGSDDGIVRLFDLRSDCKLAEYSLQKKMATSTSFGQPPSPYKERIPPSIVSSSSKEIDIPNRYKHIYSNFYTPGINSIDFSRLGRLLFACYANFGCVVWDTLRGEPVGALNNHTNKVSKVSASPDGFGVATSLWDSSVKIWTV